MGKSRKTVSGGGSGKQNYRKDAKSEGWIRGKDRGKTSLSTTEQRAAPGRLVKRDKRWS